MDKQWYELRVVGSTGPKEADIARGITLDEKGRLCAVSTGKAKRFSSADEANEFLAGLTLRRFYSFQPVLCKA